jgi:hypothetical protein
MIEASRKITMYKDEIVEEIHKYREEYAKSFNYDLKAMFDELIPDSQFEHAQINPVLQSLRDFQPMAGGQFVPPKLHPIAVRSHKAID